MADDDDDLKHILYSFCILFFLFCIINMYCSKYKQIFTPENEIVNEENSNITLNIPPKYEEIDNPPPY